VFRSRFGRLLSLVVASLSFGGHLAASVEPSLGNDRYEVANSCFAGVDYTQISVSDLSVLVGRFVAQMRARGASDRQVVQVLGHQLGKDASGCSRDQLAGLVQNVSLILADNGLQYSTTEMARTLSANFADRTGAVASDDDDVAIIGGGVY
jgi:hypothetical protein